MFWRLPSKEDVEEFFGLLECVKKKDQMCLSRAISLIENQPTLVFEIEETCGGELENRRSHVIGFTGSPGSGKSTLVDSFVARLRREGYTVGIVAVDPSSPFSGGALLGDRIRMKRHFTDDGVFIRSMGSRGSVGGLNDAVFGVITLYRLFGFDKIVVETVGAGQSEIDIVYVSDSVVLVLAPGGGDEIQLLKAGIMEIADVFVVNKSDVDGAEILKLNLETVLQLSEKDKPVVKTVATSGKGIDELFEELERHWRYINESGEIDERFRRRQRKHAETIVRKEIARALEFKNNGRSELRHLVLEALAKLCSEGLPRLRDGT